MRGRIACYSDGGYRKKGGAWGMYGSFAVYSVPEGLDCRSRSPEAHAELRDRGKLMELRRLEFVPDSEGEARGSNNVAETKTFLELARYLRDSGYLSGECPVDVYTDSQLLLMQFSGLHRTGSKRLRRIHEEIRDVLKDEPRDMFSLLWLDNSVIKSSVLGH